VQLPKVGFAAPAAIGSSARLTGRCAAVVVALLGTGCDQDGRPAAEPGARIAATATANAVGLKRGRFVQPPRRPFDPNPLRLPVRSLSIEEGATVYTVSRRALESAERGSTMVLHHAKVVGDEGGLVVVKMGKEPPYAVHPGYVVAPRFGGRLRRGSYVLAPYRQKLRHAVVVSLKGERVNVQYTDIGIKIGERRLRRDWVALQPGGLSPGNYALVPRRGTLEHVLLVSSGRWADGKSRWLALRYGAEAAVIDQEKLQPLALDFKPSVGDPVLVSWLGRMAPATVRAVDGPGLFKVQRPHVGPGLVVGADHLLPAPNVP